VGPPRRTDAAALLLAVLPLLAATTERAETAARVGEQAVSMAEVDAVSQPKPAKILERLAQVAAETVDALIAERLLAAGPLEPADVSVSDAEIDAFRRERAADFEGPFAPGGSAQDPQVQRAAIRHYLEDEARKKARADALGDLEAEQGTERLLPSAQALAHPLEPGRVVARVGGVPIHARALEQRAALRLYHLRGELARERLRNLETLIDSRLLAREAQRRGVAEEQLLTDAAGVSDEELAAYVKAEGVDPERARPYLEFRNRHRARETLLARLREEAGVEVFVREPEPPRLPVEPGDAPSLGARDGARLVAYSNYRCRACRLAHGELDRLLAFGHDVTLFFRDWIPQYDPAAQKAAALARCANEQGRFAQMRAELLRRDPPDFAGRWVEGEAGLEALARTVGVDADALAACLEKKEIREAIRRDAASARSLGFETAPAFVAEGIPLTGVQSADGLARALRDGLARR
jgi:2-hydroxychromene-2-carboxylate isomerase